MQTKSSSNRRIIRFYYDEVFDVWVIYYRDGKGPVQRITSLDRPC